MHKHTNILKDVAFLFYCSKNEKFGWKVTCWVYESFLNLMESPINRHFCRGGMLYFDWSWPGSTAGANNTQLLLNRPESYSELEWAIASL